MRNSFQDHPIQIDGKTPWKRQRSKSESSAHSFQDHLKTGNLHGEKKSDPKLMKKTQRVAEQPSSGPLPLGSHFNPIYVEPGSVTIDSTRDLQALYPNSFDCIGDMQGEYDIKTDPTVPPVQHGRWKVPIEYKEEIEKELAEMVCQRIITKQTEPTPWVSSLTYPKKANGKLRICLDPKDLNKAMIHENHKAPTLEEIAHVLMGATKFSKVDGNKAFFRMHLTEEASLLMTFNTHLGRYRFLRVPFGLKMSQDIFQMWMDDIVANIERELLAIVYGCEKFHTYLYRRTFIMETDHKPLKMISLKNLTVAPA